jgi:hypothetical protein
VLLLAGPFIDLTNLLLRLGEHLARTKGRQEEAHRGDDNEAGHVAFFLGDVASSVSPSGTPVPLAALHLVSATFGVVQEPRESDVPPTRSVVDR